ncbi:polysaccharide deacetylase family protein [Pleionea litopenaei]|uniref:Polysaccharide deacetylase family protein n=1 Tax=Pleionea litopenaei TaxID=3070815 RepID=A0AA51RRD4_9GAMM|nr:polysaccharide deacetylase family protein [Pleionea sp. HL-JVS1]WMS86191.1 polysaccharide deacetylase family protein [Pleionea sp. HL-JVS1]
MFKDKLVKPITALVNLTPDRLVKSFCGQLVPIFFLHRMYPGYDVTDRSIVQHLEWCLEYIRKNNYHPITLKELVLSRVEQRTLPKKAVVFTLDDGFYDQYEIAEPLFKKFDTPYTCFVISEFLEQKLWPWDDQIRYGIENSKLSVLSIDLPDGSRLNFSRVSDTDEAIIAKIHHQLKLLDQTHMYAWLGTFYQQLHVEQPAEIPEHYRPMTWSQAQKLIDGGNDIAPHTQTHRILSRLSDIESEQEILGSWNMLKEKLKGAAPVFAYPTGRIADYSEREMSTISQSELTCAVSTVPGHVKLASKNENLPRFVFPDNRFDFIQYLSYIEAMKEKISRH